jgi:peptidoglycan hydrolase-like protein with peptidoglycan-binding domain
MRTVALALAFLCVASVLTWPVQPASAADEVYGRVNADNVKVRKTASTSADWWFKLPKDWVSLIQDTVTKGGVTWYKVQTNGPTQGTRTYIGYIHGDYFAPMTPEDQAKWIQDGRVQPGVGIIGGTPTPTPEGMTPSPTPAGMTPAPTSIKPTPIPDPSNLGRISKGGVNFREKPKEKVIGKLENGYIVELLEIPPYLTEDYWFKVKYNGQTGYVQAQLINILTKAEADAYNNQPTPPPNPGSDTVYGYIKLNDEGINLRSTPGGSILVRLNGKPVLAYLKQPTVKSGVTWYYVKVNGIGGYIHGDYADLTDAGGNTVPSAVTPTPAPTAPGGSQEPVTAGYIKLTTDKVKLRKTPNGATLCLVAVGQILPLTAQPTVSGAYTWYPVQNTDGRKGYIRGDMASLSDQDGTTPAPTAAPSSAPVGAVGYAMVTKQSVNLRKSIGGATIRTLDKNTVWPMVSAAVKSGSYTWLPVDVNGTKGFLRSDASYQLADFQVQAYLRGEAVPTPTPTPTPTPGPSNYLITKVDKVNLRASASKDANSPYNVALGTVFSFSGSNTVGGVLWYKITYQSTNLWVQGNCVKVMNTAEYAAWLAGQPTPTPTPTPTPKPNEEDLSDMAETNTTNVLVRATGSSSGKQVSKIYEKGVIFTLTGNKNQADGYTWRSVKLKSGTTGYIREDLMRIYTKAEKQAYENSQNPTTPPGGQQEATYETLRKGSTGNAVKALQTKLKEKGFYTGSISGTYGTDTVNAVKAFQRSVDLAADGIAGSNTQHALFGTVPPGSNNNNLTNTIYPVEKIDWYTGGINTIFARGMNVKVTDVKTGITFWVHRWPAAIMPTWSRLRPPIRAACAKSTG